MQYYQNSRDVDYTKSIKKGRKTYQYSMCHKPKCMEHRAMVHSIVFEEEKKILVIISCLEPIYCSINLILLYTIDFLLYECHLAKL